ncbi:hypothetical protein [Lentilactobacillus sp. Marseille-Q4993]|uniref:hypothetical protein n=1 Tax=Lentilactobacillus sp. Marseille-Q4993 TaxID=3039492 RepID=UPI0024BCB7F2|nr:hypothetical protein [Lentilactobacillus sp. Marseille-Q4993]
MNKQASLKLIESLSNANGPSGFEDEVCSLIEKVASPFSSGFKADPMHNCYIPNNQNNISKEKTIMIDSHLDAVGLIVQAVKPNGTIKFVPLGGWVPANLTAEKMRIRNKDGKWVHGLVATKPPHFMTDAEKKEPVKIENLVIDVGTTSAEETRELLKIDTGVPLSQIRNGNI